LDCAFNIEFSHQEAEDPQEPIQAWLDVKRIHGIIDFREFDEIYTALSPSFPFIFSHFKMAFRVHSYKSANIHARLAGKARTNDMQSRTTCRTRPVTCRYLSE
jgi:hypothetical protein